MYSQFCYNAYLENENLFQYDQYIRKQFEHNTDPSICLHMILSVKKQWVNKPRRNTQNTDISNTYQLLQFTRHYEPHPSTTEVPTFFLISESPPSTTLQ